MGLRPSKVDEKHTHRRRPGEYGASPGVFFSGAVASSVPKTAPSGHGSECGTIPINRPLGDARGFSKDGKARGLAEPRP